MEILAPACYLAKGKIAQTTIPKLKLMLLGLSQKAILIPLSYQSGNFQRQLVFNLPRCKGAAPGPVGGKPRPYNGLRGFGDVKRHLYRPSGQPLRGEGTVAFPHIKRNPPVGLRR